jgi:hypothetical protein
MRIGIFRSIWWITSLGRMAGRALRGEVGIIG